MKETLKSFAPFLIALGLIFAVHLIIERMRQIGYDEGFTTAQASGEKALEKLRAEVADERRELAQQALDDAKAAADEIQKQINRGDELSSQLATTKQELRQNTDKLTGEIQRVTTLYRRTLDALPEPLPPAVFTTGFVRVWNEALNPAAMRTGEPASRAAAPAGRAGAADDLGSGITPADLLTNQVRNSEKHTTCRAQLTSLIEYYTHGR